MTPAQQSALESVAGRALTPTDIAAIDALLPARQDVQIAAVLTAGQPPRTVSVAVEEVFDALFETGDYVTLKQAQLSGNALAVMAFGMLADAKTIGPGKVNLQSTVTTGMLDQLQAADLLSQAGRDALTARSTVAADPIHYNAVSDALNVAEGRMVL